MVNSKQDESWMNFVDRTKPEGYKGGTYAPKPPVRSTTAHKQAAYYQQSAPVVAQLVQPAPRQPDVLDVILKILQYIRLVLLVIFGLLLLLGCMACNVGVVPSDEYLGLTFFCFVNWIGLGITSLILKAVKKSLK